jgi:HK97 family phage major capsid protein
MTVSASGLPEGTALALIALSLANVPNGNLFKPAAYAKQRFRGMPLVAETIEKAAVTGTTPSDFGTAITTSGIGADFISAVRGAEVLGRLPGVRRVSFNVPVPRLAGGFSAGWVTPGGPIPVSKGTLGTITLAPSGVKAIAAFTEELMQSQLPSATEDVRRGIVYTVAANTDELLLNPDQAAVVGTSPASITNTAVEITQSGTTAAALLADFRRMISAHTVPLKTPAWVMRPETYASVLATFGFAIAPADALLLGFPVLTTTAAPLDVASPTPAKPSTISFINGSYILVAEGAVRIDAGNATSLQLSDVPTNSTATGTATTMVSMLQTQRVRCVREISFARAVDGSVSFMRVDYL